MLGMILTIFVGFVLGIATTIIVAVAYVAGIIDREEERYVEISKAPETGETMRDQDERRSI